MLGKVGGYNQEKLEKGSQFSKGIKKSAPKKKKT